MKRNKILLAEDDKNLGSILKEFLQLKDYEVKWSLDGVEAWKIYNETKFDLCLFDIMMPQKDGFTLAKEIRKTDKEIPIIFLTSKSLPEDKIEGFKIGGDDYITKPFNTEELLLRIKAILKRTQKDANTNQTTQFKIGKYKFDSDSRMLKFGNNTITLTSKESELLKLLCEHENKILKREIALNMIWKESNYFTARSMDVYITKLRKYLSEDTSVTITNFHGVGYMMSINEN